jgi:hypothetical protein
VRELARLRGETLTETIREAVEHEIMAIRSRPPLIEHLQSIQADFQALKRPGGQPADKAFFDALSEEE